MNKDEAVKFLIENGYDAEMFDNIPTANITVKKLSDMRREEKKIEKILRDNGYMSSIGMNIKFE